MGPRSAPLSSAAPAAYPLADVALARRLEGTEARGNSAYVERKARLLPASGAEWTEVAGASAMFDGVGSPLTQTFGLGLFQPASDPDLDRLEAFFRARGAAVMHEVSPLADAGTLELLARRGYSPVEYTSVLYRPIDAALRLAGRPDGSIHVRRIGPAEASLWARTAAEGWREEGDLDGLMDEVARVNAGRAEAPLFLAELDGAPIAAGASFAHGGVALLAGACTVPAARRRGAQLALLEHRLRHAAEQGCDVAMLCAGPGSGSQRNAERHGFRIAYTRIKWRLNAPEGGA